MSLHFIKKLNIQLRLDLHKMINILGVSRTGQMVCLLQGTFLRFSRLHNSEDGNTEGNIVFIININLVINECMNEIMIQKEKCDVNVIIYSISSYHE